MTPENLRMLIPQYLAGELTHAELELLESRLETDVALQAEVDSLRIVWQGLGLLSQPDPRPAMRAQFYQKLNAVVQAKPIVVARTSWWNRATVPQWAAAAIIFVVGFGAGHMKAPQREQQSENPGEVSQLRNQVEGLRQTVALSLMDKQSASSRLQGVEWSSQVDRPDQELLSALLTTLNQDPNINVRLASLDALEKFTSDGGVRKALEQSITRQQSPLVQIALIDALVHIRDHSAAQEFKQLSGDAGVDAAVRQRAQWAVQKLSLN